MMALLKRNSILAFFGFLLLAGNLAHAQSAAELIQLQDVSQTRTSFDEQILPIESKSHVFAGISFEPYHLIGSYQTSSSGSLNLADAGWSVLPVVSVGYLGPKSPLADFMTNWGFDFSFSGSSQNFSSATDQGVGVNGTLSTWNVAFHPLYRFHWRSSEKIYTVIRGELGMTEVHLQTTNQAAQFNLQDGFLGYGLGLEWDPNTRYGIVGLYYERVGFMGSSPWNAGGSGVQLGSFMIF